MTHSMRHFFTPNGVAFILILLNLIVGVFLPRLLAYLPAVSGLILASTLYMHKIPFFKSEKHIFICLISIITLAALSALWSINPEFTIKRTIKVTLILLPGFLFYIGARTMTLTPKQMITILLSLCAICAILFLEKNLGHPVISYMTDDFVKASKLNRNFVVIALLSIPFLYFLKRLTFKYKPLILISLITLLGIVMIYTHSQTALLSYWVGVAFLFGFPNNKCMIRLFFIGLMILSCVFPFLIKPIKQSIPEEVLIDGFVREASIIHRFEIWEFSVDSTMKKPFLGHGLDSLRFLKSDKWMPYQRADNALHSHNVILQLWVEFGVIGAIILMLFLFMMMQKMLRIDDLQKRKFYLAVFATTTSCAMTGYGFWQSWQLGLFIFLMTLSVVIANIDYKNNPKAS